jgi:formylglycine-generating enzyme required for sulfatase activity
MTSRSIFISHSSRDSEAAARICAALEDRGFDCWISRRDVAPGQNFQESIVEAIGSGKVMILVFSDNANSSGEIKKELAIASQRSLVVIPVRIENAAPKGAFAYELATRQWIDLFGDWDQGIERLASHLQQVIPAGGSGQPTAAAARRVENRTRGSRLWPAERRARGGRIIIVLLLVFAGVGAVLWVQGIFTDVGSFRDCSGCPEMVKVPAGSFVMGSSANETDRDDDEGPQHQVRIARPFAVGKFVVTVEQYAAFVQATGHESGNSCSTWTDGKWSPAPGRSWRNPGYAQEPSHPAVCLSWNDAKAYAAWLSGKTGKPYRLLTEAEWEYAARAGSPTRYYFGDEDGDFCRFGNGADQTAKKAHPYWTALPCDDGYLTTAPVGAFKPNRFGLYDMLGNVWQWVEDCYTSSYRDAPTDGTARMSADCRLHSLRGGSWNDSAKSLRSASRNGVATEERNNTDGLRVARALE